ncbi:RNA-directed DNA polymerase from mobile element jockey-like [Brachionus plicatilis]|uniref:RNA-directed DNA polymerase from mobile element jockey-like n=1 Tax=Brachionus plicatilis TaxID=10195 RepID=A0A3M7T8Z4_BRAPC|nr:RNA-directed DNA polymerase from mobile element jockey-like [Brachionus plicatilis]
MMDLESESNSSFIKRIAGSALCIKKSIKGSPIKIDNFPETVGYKINLKHGNELALFSHYSSPSTELNEKLFEYATNNFKFFIIVGDFNAWNSNWFCPKSNKKGNVLLSTIEKLDLFILNNETPTYKRNKLTYLKEFNQSESKHWQALLSINKENNSNKKFINLRNDNHSTSDPAEIAELFACNLENIFTYSKTSVRQGSSIFQIGSYMHITRDEMMKTLKTTKSRAGFDLISNKVVNRIIEYCKKWGFKINEKKTCYTTFTKAGLRKNYEKRYGMKIKIGNIHIPLDPNPTFLGIKLDPKINYKEHLKIINSKQISKINLIRKIKSFKWRSSFKINRILYMSLIRSLFDYCFIILQSGT